MCLLSCELERSCPNTCQWTRLDIWPIVEEFFEIVCYGEEFELSVFATLLMVRINLKKLDLNPVTRLELENSWTRVKIGWPIVDLFFLWSDLVNLFHLRPKLSFNIKGKVMSTIKGNDYIELNGRQQKIFFLVWSRDNKL